MARMRSVVQKMPDALHVHHMMAAVVRTMPSGVSMGITMPTRLVATSGRRQYPSTLAERANVMPLDGFP